MRLNNLRTIDSLKVPSFRIYYLSMIGQWAAQAMQNVVQGLLVYRLTGSTAILGTMALGSAIQEAHNANRPGGYGIDIPDHRHFPVYRIPE